MKLPATNYILPVYTGEVIGDTGRTAVEGVSIQVPAGTDRRRAKREFRKVCLALGFKNSRLIARAMGFKELV